jgi:hypothetical protein
MAAPHVRLAASLTILHDLQREGRRVFRSGEISRTHRERLVKAGFLADAMKGWLFSTHPDAAPGDTTPWYSSMWEFCALYCEDRFGADWNLSADQSLLLHAENTVVPRQILVHAPKGGGNVVALPHGTSLYDIRSKAAPPPADMATRDGLRLFTVEAALVRVPEGFYQRHPVEAQVCLAMLRDTSGLLRHLLDNGSPVVAGRLAGAYRRIGRSAMADEIAGTMAAAGYRVSEIDPFEPQAAVAAARRQVAPIATRLRSMWAGCRDDVAEAFRDVPVPGPVNIPAYMAAMDGIYQADAYHSLSIEGYRVDARLVDRVKGGGWNPAANEEDRRSRDALAARGYWQAFQRVRSDVLRILEGKAAAEVFADGHRAWYREMFQPCVQAGLLEASALAGYRSSPVYLRGSRFVPPRSDAVPDAMEELGGLLKDESDARVRAVLGHWLFGYVHPFPDGNGRSARFAMNLMLASGGYPWTVIRVDDRESYLAALDAASVEGQIRPFAKFVAERVKWAMGSDPAR